MYVQNKLNNFHLTLFTETEEKYLTIPRNR